MKIAYSLQVKVIRDIYKMFVKNSAIKVFDPTFLLCMPLHENEVIEKFLIDYINYSFIRYEYMKRYISK